MISPIKFVKGRAVSPRPSFLIRDSLTIDEKNLISSVAQNLSNVSPSRPDSPSAHSEANLGGND